MIPVAGRFSMKKSGCRNQKTTMVAMQKPMTRVSSSIRFQRSTSGA